MASRRSTPLGHAARAARRLRHESLEKRELLAAEITGPQLISVAANSGENFNLLGNNQLNVAPQQLTMRFSGGQEIDPATLAAIKIIGSGGDGNFTNGNEQVITPGFIGLGDSTRIVIARFSSDLPDDQYRISISGFDQTNIGQVSLRNTLGERFQAANPPDSSSPTQEVFFNVELGARVVAVVPQPVTTTTSPTGTVTRVPHRNQIYVYFNNDPLTNPSAGPVSSTNSSTDPTVVQPRFYNLFVTKDTVEPGDDGNSIQPTAITYDPALRRATLTFGSDLSAIPSVAASGGSATLRLRVGSSQSLPLTLTPFSGDLTADVQDTFTNAQALPIPGAGFGGGNDASIVINGEISASQGNTINWPGIDSPGVRDDRRDAQVVGRADTNDGIDVFFYNFANLYGSDAAGNDLENAITPAQKQRAREILDLYSRQLGVQFIESEDRGLQIVTGDMRALVQGATTGPGAPFQEYRVNDLDPSQGVLILDAAEPWYDGYGLSPDARPSWFVEAIRGIGNLLGLGPTFEQVPGVASGSDPSLYTAAQFGITGNFSIEPDFLSSSDIVPLQALHRPEIRDADLYSFNVTERGRISVETYAQRKLDSSTLDTDLKLWKLNPATGQYELVARNSDFYGNDSFIGVDVDRNADGSNATYVIGITAAGNDDYNPDIAGSGGGGRTQGLYDMRVSFESSSVGTILDTNNSRLDGDSDGAQGGDFNFWFRTAKTKDVASPGEVRTLYVDANNGVDATTSGTLTVPYKTIQYAISQSALYAANQRPGEAKQDIIRLLADAGPDGRIDTTADNLAYEIGRGGSGNLPLKDGESLEVPKGVTVMIDAGAILKLRNAKISVGSESIDDDRSLAALQVLGEPTIIDTNPTSPTFNRALTGGSVQFTSFNEERRNGVLFGLDNNPIPTTAGAGDWAGIEFRNDVDYSEGRGVWETEGIFLDYVSHADIRYGGGSVTLTDPIVTPLQMFESRPTLIYNHISDSRDAAISADPDSFEETNFNAPQFQQASIDRFGTTFTSDYDRVGPLVRGNLLERNSLNGLFVRVDTPAVDVRKPLTTSARFDDRDITHVFSEVLVLQGNPGGPQALEDRPDVLNVTVGPGSNLPAPATPLSLNRVVDYRITFVTADGMESLASAPTRNFTVGTSGTVQLSNLPAAPPEFAGRRLYRVTPSGSYEFVTQLDRATPTYRDSGITRGGRLRLASIPETSAVAVSSPIGSATGTLPLGTSLNYRFTYVTAGGLESLADDATTTVTVQSSRTVVLGSSVSTSPNRLPAVPAEFVGLNVYRLAGTDYELVTTLAPGTAVFTDTGNLPATGVLLSTAPVGSAGGEKLLPRLNARLSIDPGLVMKMDSARIEATFGADFYAEGTDGNPVVFTSRKDDRYGAGGTFDTNNDGFHDQFDLVGPKRGDWSGLVFRQGSSASIDNAVISFGGGESSVGGGFAYFNPIEVLQADVRIAHSTITTNASGTPLGNTDYTIRDGAGFNGPATIFIRGAQPVIVDNIITDNTGAAISINPDALNYVSTVDPGRGTGAVARFIGDADNQGPLVEANRLDNNIINGMLVRNEALTTESVWDDTDIVHVVENSVYAWNHHHRSTLRLKSDPNQSLVVKVEEGGSLNADRYRTDVEDSIGGTIQVIGQPGFPVVLTSINDCEVGAGFTPTGLPQNDTIESGACSNIVVDAAPFVDVVVVIDESGSLGFAQQFTAQFITDLEAGLLAAGVGSTTAGGNRYGAVGFGNGIDPVSDLGRSIMVGGGLYGTASDYVAATSQFVTTGASEDGYAAINFALQNYTFRPEAKPFFILVTDEPRVTLDANQTAATTIAGLQSAGVTLVGILTANIVDSSGNPALAIDNTTVFTETANGFTSSPGGSITPGFFDAAADYVPLVTATNGVTGDFDSIALSPATAATFSQVMTQTLVDRVSTGNPATAGDWQGIVINPGSNDRNVAFVPEAERAIGTAAGVNAIPGNAQIIGSLARNEVSADENRRLGFNIRGTLSQNADIDVYKFTANGGTEVYFDIDDTDLGLDTVVELIDINGNIFALSDSSENESTAPASLINNLGVSRVLPLYKTGKTIVENPNPMDAGMRVILPGNSATVNDYFVRVRSSNLNPGDPLANLGNPLLVGGGRSAGQYQLSLRLRETDEIAGTTVRLADVRYATTAIDIPAAPSNSPLVGEFAEELDQNGLDLNQGAQNIALGTIFGGTASVNFANGDADPLGPLNASERGVLRVSGELGNNIAASNITPDYPKEMDIDVFRVDIFANTQATDIINENRFVTTVFDVDYADQFGGPNTSLAVFDSAGRLILHSRDSNVADDQGRPSLGNDPTNLSSGSAGTLDAFIGPVELQEGTYYVAVSSAQMVPEVLNQLFTDSPAENAVRVLPIDSTRRLAEWGFDEDFLTVNGILNLVGTDEFVELNTAADLPTIRPLFDDTSIVPYKLEDVRLFLTLQGGLTGNNQTTLVSVDPFTGQLERTIGEFGPSVGDLAIRRDGELFSYSHRPNQANAGNTGNYLNVSSADGSINNAGDDGLTYNQNNQAGTGTENDANGLIEFTAMSFVPVADITNSTNGGAGNNPAVNNNERFFAVGNRTSFGRGELPDELRRNIIYSMVATDGAATNQGSTNTNADRNFGNTPYIELFGPGSNKQELGIIDTGQFADSPVPPDGAYTQFDAGGDVTGIALDPVATTSQVFAITNNGYLYSFNPTDRRVVDVENDGFGGLLGSYNRVINTVNYGQVPPHPDDFNSFNGVNFQSLSFGPRNTELGRYENILFGVTQNGWLYSFTANSLTGRVEPAPILFNGNYAIPLVDEDGFTLFEQPTGMAFSTRQENIWHTTGDFAGPFGNPDPHAHGVFPGYDQTRTRISGGSSLYFGNEIDGTANNNTLQGGNGTLNPGGVHGSTVSAPFSLEGYAAADKPTLYFTYLLETETNSDYTLIAPGRPQTDSFRVFAAGDDGQWRLVSTNNSWRRFSNTPSTQLGGDGFARGDEYDYFASNGGIPVQELYDNPENTNSTDWRQARVDLSPLAGNKSVQLRFDFSTAGGMQSQNRVTGYLTELQVTPGTEIIDGSTFTLQDSTQAFSVGTTQTFEFVRGAAFSLPSGNVILNGQTITVVNALGVSTTLTLTTDPASTATNPVLFSRTDSADVVASAVVAALNTLDPSLVAVATGNGVRIPEAASFTVTPEDFGAAALTVPDANPNLVGRSLTFTSETGRATTITLQTQQQISFGFGPERIQLTADIPGTADNVRVQFVDIFNPLLPPIVPPVDPAASASYDPTTRLITVTYNSDPLATPTNNDYNAVIFALNNMFAFPGDPTFTAVLSGGTGTVAFTPPLTTPMFASNEVYFTMADTADVIVTAISNKLSQLDPSLVGSLGQGSIIIPTDLTLIDFSTLTFTNQLGATIQVTPVDIPGNFGGGFVSYSSVSDTPSTVAQRLAARINLLDPTLGAVAVGNGISVPGAASQTLGFGYIAGSSSSFGADQLILTGAVNVPITVPADLTDTALDGATLTFVSTAGATTTLTLTTSVPTAGTQVQYDPINDTPAQLAQRIAQRIRTASGFNLNATATGDQITVTGARGIALHPAFSNGTINLGTLNVGTTAEGFLPNGNVPIYYSEGMTNTEVRDAVRDALARGIGSVSTAGISQADTSNFPEYGTQRIRVYNQSVISNSSVVGVSSYLPGDEFGTAVSASVSDAFRITRPGQNNDIQGIYIDDIVIGFAERGEVVYNAPSNRNFVALPETRSDTFQDTQQPEFLDEQLVGHYTLEIRGGAEFGVPEDYDPVRLQLDEQFGFGRSFDTNDRMDPEAVTLIAPRGVDLIDGDVFVLSNGSQQLTFEFDSNNSVINGRVRVPFAPVFNSSVPGSTYSPAADDSTALARSIRDAINSTQAFNVLGIYAASTDSRDAGAMSGNRIELFGNAIQVNPTSGRFSKVDLVAEETFYGRETARVIPVVDHANQTVIDAVFPNTFARATTTNFINGSTDTLVAVGKIGDNVLTRDGGSEILYRNGILADLTLPASGVVNNNGNALIPLTPNLDLDIVKIYLQAGDVIDLDLDTVGWNLGTEFTNPSMAIFGEVAGSDPQFEAATTISIAPGEVNASAFLDDFTAPRSGYYYVAIASFTGADNYGEYQLNIRPGTVTSNGVTVVRDVLMVDYHFDKGDTNVERPQGQYIIESNFISDFATTGIRADFGNPNTDDDTFFSSLPIDRRPGAAATLRNPNSDRLIPGTVISNNVILAGGGTGIVYLGETAAAGDSPAPVPFGRIVNNTIVSSGGGTGINVGASASPTVLNNIITGFNLGLNISADSSSTVEGGNAYQSNNTDASRQIAASSVSINNALQLFQDSSNRIYIPASGSEVIDSSFASLGDRTNFVNTVKGPVGIATSPIIAPRFDAYGIPRFDDPTVTTPSGVGSNTFIDRGAIDRADFVRPIADLASPLDFVPGGVSVTGGDVDPSKSFVRLTSGSVRFFEIQLFDPSGSGPDPRTITADSVILTENGRRLLPGVDYTFGYSDNSRLARLTPLGGLWLTDAVYDITLNNEDRVGLDLQAGDVISDGDRYQITDASGRVSNFEFDSGYVLEVPQTLGLQVNGPNTSFVDGETFTISLSDSLGIVVATRTFEINRAGTVRSGNVPVNIGSPGGTGINIAPTIQTVRDALLTALNSVATELNLAPRALGTERLQIGSLEGHSITGTVSGLGFFGVAAGVVPGDQFQYTVAGGATELFEFTTGPTPVISPSARTIQISRMDSVDEIAAKIAAAVVASPLGLIGAREIADGRVLLGGAPADSLTILGLANNLIVDGTAGVTGKLTITIPMGTLPSDLEATTFTVRNGSEVETFQFTSVTPLPVTSNRLIVLGPTDPEDIIAQKIAATIDAGIVTLAPTAVGATILLNERDATAPVQVLASVASTGATPAPLVYDGVSGGAIPVPYIPTSAFTPQSAATAFVSALNTSPLAVQPFSPGGGTLLFTGVDPNAGITLTNAAGTVTSVGQDVPAISDLAGNAVDSNRDDDETRFTIIMPEVRFDYGDAPNSYGTLLAADGARHALVGGSTLRLGQFIDGEDNAVVPPNADDVAVGVTISSSSSAINTDLSVPANPKATVVAVPTSGNFVSVSVGSRTTQFQFVLATENPSTGRVGVVFAPGEALESIAQKLLTAIRADFATTAVGGVLYTVDPATPTTIELLAVDDEDGVSIGTFTPASGGALRVFSRFGAPTPLSEGDVVGFINPKDPAGTNFQVAVSGTGLLDVFVDFNRDGDFADPGERAVANAGVTDGINTLTIFSPTNAIDGDTWIRLRLSESGNLGPRGVAIGGEVEDYQITIRGIDPPVPVNDSYTTTEDTVLNSSILSPPRSLILNDTGLSSQLITQKVFVAQQPASGNVVIDETTGHFTYTPNADFNGVDTFTYRIGTQPTASAASLAGANLGTVSITVTGVNDPPQFTVISTNNILEDEGAANSGRSVTIPGVITNVTAGPLTATDEVGDPNATPPVPASQTVILGINVVASTIPSGLMTAPATISATGDLTVFPALNAYGTAIYAITVSDNGLPAGSGLVTTLVTVNVRPVNDPPQADPTRLGQTSSAGPDNSYLVANVGNPSFAAGTLIYTFKEDGGPFFIPLRQANSGLSFSRIGLLDPFLAGPANETVTHEGGPQSIQLSLIPSTTGAQGTLTPVTATGSTTIIGYNYTPPVDLNSNIAAFDTFTYEILDQNGAVPANPEGYLNANGVPVDDAKRATNQVVLILNPVNDTPQFNIPTRTVTVPEDGAALFQQNFATNIFAGPPLSAFDEVDVTTGQEVNFTVTSLTFPQSQAALFFTEYPTISPDGSLRFRAAPDVFGNFRFNVVLNDDDPAGNTTRGDDISSEPIEITISVLPVNDRPSRVPGAPGADLAFTLAEDTSIDIPVNGTAQNRGLLDLFNVGPANEAANIAPSVGGNQTLSLDTPLVASTINGGTLTPITNQAGQIIAVRYRPRANFVGADSFTYAVVDNGSTIDLDGTTRLDPQRSFSTVNFDITPVNDAPLFGGGSNVVADEDAGPVSITSWASNVQAGPLGADDEINGVTGGNPAQTLNFEFTYVSGPANLLTSSPSATISGSSATLNFTPAADANGVVVYTVRLVDSGSTGQGNANASPTQTFSIRVNPINDPPSFVAGPTITVLEDSGAYRENWATSVSPGPADEQTALQSVSFEVVPDSASTGLFQNAPTIDSAGILQFTPAANANGTANVTVRAIDSAGAVSADVTLQIVITPVNDAPLAVTDTVNTDEDRVLTISSAQLLANDTDPDLIAGSGEVLSVVMPPDQFSVSGARVRFDSVTGQITYDPTLSDTIQSLAPGETLTDSFSYRVRDIGGLESAAVTVSLRVDGINDAPRLVPDDPSLNPSGPTIIRPLLNDSDIDGTIDPTSLTITLQPSFGSLSISPDGTLTYTPFPTGNGQPFTGEDLFRYSVADDLGQQSPEATVTISANAAPIANTDTGGTFRDEAVIINVAANDIDPDTVTPSNPSGNLDLSSIQIVSAPTRGDAVPLANGTVRYIPGLGFSGLDSFTYTIADTDGRRSQPATVRLQVVSSRLQNPAVDRIQDVNDDGSITAADSLAIINRLNIAQSEGNTTGIVPVLPTDRGPLYYDVDGNGIITAGDALEVLRILNERDALGQGGQSADSEGESLAQQAIPSSSLTASRLETSSRVVDPVAQTLWEEDSPGSLVSDDALTALAIARQSGSSGTESESKKSDDVSAVDEVLRLFAD